MHRDKFELFLKSCSQLELPQIREAIEHLEGIQFDKKHNYPYIIKDEDLVNNFEDYY